MNPNDIWSDVLFLAGATAVVLSALWLLHLFLGE